MAEHAEVRAESYLAPETLAQLSPFELRAKMIVEGVTSGMHRSPYQGMAVEFAAYRQYVMGDDPRHLDWKVFGRTDKLYVKQFQQETNLDVILMVDASSSMGFGTLEVKSGWGGTQASRRISRWTKFDHATALATAISYLCLGQGDRVGVAVFSGELHSLVRRSSAQGQWRKIVNCLRIEPMRSTTNLAHAVDQALGKVHNHALFVIISDFFEGLEGIRQSLARLKHRRHDVLLLHTLDRQEMRFDLSQSAPFEGLEAEGSVRVDPRALRQDYLEILGAHCTELSRMATGFGFDCLRVDTHESVGPPLAYLLARRSASLKRSKIG